MSGGRLYPRLPRPLAEARWESVRDLSLDALASAAAGVHSDAIYAATGGNRANPQHMEEIRVSILKTARRHGYPKPAGRAEAGAFDAEAAECLFRLMKIAPGEASREGVWSFVALMLLPDVARWRFPDSGPERFLGGASHRNAFQRLWWRAYALRDARATDEFHLLKRLPEDALVGIMERPGISSNTLLARVIAQEAARIDERVPGVLLEDVRRDAYKRIRQRAPVVTFDVLGEEQIRQQIEPMFSAAAENLVRKEREQPAKGA